MKRHDDIYKVYHHKYWDLYKHAFPVFLSTLPVFQFVENIQKKLGLQKVDNDINIDQQYIFDDKNSEEVLRVFQDNVSVF